MEYIGRDGATNREVSMACPGHFLRTAARIVSASASSHAPFRSMPLTSVSSSANRHDRSLPFAVSRIRLQFPQKGRLTEAISPTFPNPSVYRYSVAGVRGLRQ